MTTQDRYRLWAMRNIRPDFMHAGAASAYSGAPVTWDDIMAQFAGNKL